MFKYSLIFLLLLSAFHCQQRAPRTVNTAFHHWKSQLQLSDFERNYCQSVNAKTLYLRLFDVDAAARSFAEPIAELHFLATDLRAFDSIIPTVFITNRTLINTDATKIDSLTALIFQKIRTITEGGMDNNKTSALLIDCDWTATTKDKFFQLIQQLKTLSDKPITTTIRLHQVKFKDKTGVPPADKGLLMAYNTGDISNPKTQNSILDITVLKAYIADLGTYPLPLDVALPIFSWGIVKRDGQAVQLVPHSSKDFLVKNGADTEGSSFQEKSNKEIEILKNGYYNGLYLYADDVIKIEEVSLNDLKRAADLLSQYINNPHITVSFFSLDSVNLSRYASKDVLNLVQRF
jgi:hypothetical protein